MKEQLQVRGKHFLSRFPKALDERIIEGIERMTAAAPHQFISQRGWPHLRRLLLFQFLVQKKIECEIKNGTPKVGAKFFLAQSRLCLIATIPFVQKERVVDKECLIKTLQRLAPGINEVPGSFWRWLHPEFPYMVLYIEMQRLRGGAFTHQELIRLSDKDRYITEDGTIAVFKTFRPMEVQPFIFQAKQNQLVFTEFDFDSMRYFCVREIQNCHGKIFFPPKKCQNLRLMFLEGQPPSLSPYLAGGDIRCCTISKWLFEGLTRLDATGVPKPAGAESIHVSEDGKLYTFQLRPSNWSNGKPVTSLDYLIGWKKVLKREWVSNRPELLFVIKNGKSLYHQLCQEHELGVQTPNPTTLQVELEYPDPYFLAKLSYPLFFPTIDDSQEPRYFNGPYTVKRYTQKNLDLEINPAFWDAKNIHFHQIQIGSGGSIEEINHYFRKNEVDWIGNPFGVLSSALMCAFENEGILRKHPVKRPFVIYLNTRHILLRSHIIRRALSLALDRTFICDQFFPNCTPLYTLFAGTQVVSENVQEAQLLFKKGLDILQVEQPISPLVIHYAQLPGHTEFAHYLQTVWRNTFGLAIHIQGQPWNFFRNTLERKDFQIAGCFINEMAFDSLEFLRRFEDVKGCTNFSNWDHAVYQSIMAAAPSAKGEKRLQLIQEAASIFTHETPVIPVCNQSLYFAKHPHLQGEVINVFGHVDFRFAFKKE